MPKYPPGDAPAAYYPVVGTQARTVSPQPLAPYYDPGIRDLVMTNGIVQAMHPVDHEVIVRLGITDGMVLSAPDGLDLDPVFAAVPARRASVLDGQVRDRVADMVKAGKIDVLAVRLLNVAVNPTWRLEWEIVYRNLLLPGTEPVRRKYAYRRR